MAFIEASLEELPVSANLGPSCLATKISAPRPSSFGWFRHRSGPNLIFTSTLAKMGLNYMSLLTPSKAPFYGIIPGNSSTPIGSVTLPVTFGTEQNFRTEYIKFEVAEFEVLLPCDLGKTCTSQVHGSATLCLPAPQDARQHRSPFTTGRLPQVLRVRQVSNRSCCHNSGP